MSRQRLLYMVPTAMAIMSIAAAYFLEYHHDLVPCTLCLMERGLMWLILPPALWGLLQPSRSAPPRWGAPRVLVLIVALLGMLVAGRHTWLQQFGGSTGCAPELDYMLHHWPWQKTVTMLLSSEECALVDWTFLGLSLAAWALVAYAVILLWMLVGTPLLQNKSAHR